MCNSKKIMRVDIDLKCAFKSQYTLVDIMSQGGREELAQFSKTLSRDTSRFFSLCYNISLFLYQLCQGCSAVCVCVCF